MGEKVEIRAMDPMPSEECRCGLRPAVAVREAGSTSHRSDAAGPCAGLRENSELRSVFAVNEGPEVLGGAAGEGKFAIVRFRY